MSAEATLGAIARAAGAETVRHFGASPAQLHVLRAMADCRTAAMGGHRDQCDRCGAEHTFWNSCRDRHCPGCGAEAREAWLERRRAELLDVPYFHAVFTIPACLRALAFAAPAVVYPILLRAAGHALTRTAAGVTLRTPANRPTIIRETQETNDANFRHTHAAHAPEYRPPLQGGRNL